MSGESNGCVAVIPIILHTYTLSFIDMIALNSHKHSVRSAMLSLFHRCEMEAKRSVPVASGRTWTYVYECNYRINVHRYTKVGGNWLVSRHTWTRVDQQMDEDVQTVPPQSQPAVYNSGFGMWLCFSWSSENRVLSVNLFHCLAVNQNPWLPVITHPVIWIPMSCFKNKTALAKINEDLLVVNPMITFSAHLPGLLSDINSVDRPLPEPLFYDSLDITSFCFLVACLDSLPSLFHAVLCHSVADPTIFFPCSFPIRTRFCLGILPPLCGGTFPRHWVQSSEMSPDQFEPLVLKVWFQDQQHQPYLRTHQEFKFSDITPGQLNWDLQHGAW